MCICFSFDFFFLPFLSCCLSTVVSMFYPPLAHYGLSGLAPFYPMWAPQLLRASGSLPGLCPPVLASFAPGCPCSSLRPMPHSSTWVLPSPPRSDFPSFAYTAPGTTEIKKLICVVVRGVLGPSSHQTEPERAELCPSFLLCVSSTQHSAWHTVAAGRGINNT